MWTSGNCDFGVFIRLASRASMSNGRVLASITERHTLCLTCWQVRPPRVLSVSQWVVMTALSGQAACMTFSFAPLSFRTGTMRFHT